MQKNRRNFTPEFKLEVAKKIVQQQHSVAELCRELDVGETAVRRWVAQYIAESNGQRGIGLPLTPDQQRIRQLEAELRIAKDHSILLPEQYLPEGSCSFSSFLQQCFFSFCLFY